MHHLHIYVKLLNIRYWWNTRSIRKSTDNFDDIFMIRKIMHHKNYFLVYIYMRKECEKDFTISNNLPQYSYLNY